MIMAVELCFCLVTQSSPIKDKIKFMNQKVAWQSLQPLILDIAIVATKGIYHSQYLHFYAPF
jgi:hypothetical protein